MSITNNISKGENIEFYSYSMQEQRLTGTQPIIGIFDSGMGGLSVLHEMRLLMPHAHLIYIADSAWLPYGNKSEAFIQQRSEIITQNLIDQGASLIVVACNTATAAAVTYLRQTFDVPIIGMEPAVKPAAELTQTGVIAVLATENTTKSDRLASLTTRFAHHIKVLTQPCHGLVELVEAHALDTPETVALLEKYINPLLLAQADVIILGCTHYPFLKPTMQRLVGEQVQILDTGAALARYIQKQLSALNLDNPHNDGNQSGSETFYSTGHVATANYLLARFWLRDCSCLPLLLSGSSAIPL